jgi:prolyl-tRNA editing enzyme YbaK/EbsC (Cys-tRNA(Pro) deacylase)
VHPRAEQFRDRVRGRLDFDIDPEEFPEGTKTAADAAAAIGCDVSQIASSIVFVAGDQPVVVVTSGANRVDEATLAAVLDEDDARTASPEEVREATGYAIGGVPPFAHDGEVSTYIDETLLDHERVWAAAGTPEAVFPVAPERLRELAGAEPVDVTG